MPLFFIAIVFNILQLALAQTHGTEISGEDEKKQNFTRAFVKSLGIIIASEIGDKTFFIAAIMAMKHPRAVVSDLVWLCSYEMSLNYSKSLSPSAHLL